MLRNIEGISLQIVLSNEIQTLPDQFDAADTLERQTM